MHKLITLSLVTTLLGCEVGERPVPPASGVDGAQPQHQRDGAQPPPVKRDLGPTITPPPPSAKGDLTTCKLINAPPGSNNECGVATSYPGPLAFNCWGEKSCSVKVTAPLGTELSWKSTCGGYAYSVVDGKPDTIGFVCGAKAVMEMVTCTFAGSSGKQSCTTAGLPGPFRCSGVGSCKVYVLTEPGLELHWTSSCKGTHSTTVDGSGHTLAFSCN